MKIFLTIIIAYLLGNFQTSYLLGKVFMKTDIREFGSGNAGTTNALRVYGKKFAIATLLLDIIKGSIAVLVGKYFLGETGALVAGISVVCGHNWPVVLKFKGGKGIATTIGVGLAISPLIASICVVIGVLIIAISKMVSLGTLSAIVIWPIISYIFMFIDYYPMDYRFLAFTVVLALIAIYKHRANIVRLIKGEESKLGSKA